MAGNSLALIGIFDTALSLNSPGSGLSPRPEYPSRELSKTELQKPPSYPALSMAMSGKESQILPDTSCEHSPVLARLVSLAQ